MGDEFLQILDASNASRDFSNKSHYSACYAPFVSMYLDQLGNVRACCQNTKYPLGNILEQPLLEIWRGERASRLRRHLESNDLTHGCQFCEWQILEGNTSGVFMKLFDRFEVASHDPPFPLQMEFSISNTCNLECVMCNGEWSSSIRTRREKRAPIPKVFGDSFFEQLREFLPHLRQVKFLGGEPFLAQETLRLMELMMQEGVQPICHITTNGTQYNERVERILQSLPISISMSLDGVTPETVEAIRRNASYDDLMTNFQRFRESCRQRGLPFTLTFCLMRPNWREFGDYLLLGDRNDCDVYVNTVTNPNDLSLYTLPKQELAPIVEQLEEQGRSLLPRLSRNRHVWVEELDRLRQRLGHGDEPVYYREWDALFSLTPTLGTSTVEEEAKADLNRWADRGVVASFWSESSQMIVRAEVYDAEQAGFDDSNLVGRHMYYIQDLLSQKFGRHIEVVLHDRSEKRVDSIVRFRNEQGCAVEARGLTIPAYDEQGRLAGTQTLMGLRKILSESRATGQSSSF